MTIYQYCTPEWLAESAVQYEQNPKLKRAMQKLIMKVAFKITANPELGIDQDILFAAYVNQGDIEKLGFISEAEAKKEVDYILATSPQQWTKILRKQSMFAGDVMLGRIAIEKGSKPGVIKIAPYSTAFVDALTQVDVQYPDEMSPDELEKYRNHVNEFRTELGV
jgi:putative sterol carrier protein